MTTENNTKTRINIGVLDLLIGVFFAGYFGALGIYFGICSGRIVLPNWTNDILQSINASQAKTSFCREYALKQSDRNVEVLKKCLEDVR